MFADMGHFSRRSIQIGLMGIVVSARDACAFSCDWWCAIHHIEVLSIVRCAPSTPRSIRRLQ